MSRESKANFNASRYGLAVEHSGFEAPCAHDSRDLLFSARLSGVEDSDAFGHSIAIHQDGNFVVAEIEKPAGKRHRVC